MASSETQFETDAFLKLLTDALRAGPGSPQWHEALAHLKSAPASEAEEYRLLIAARENLASGREYREVRAGPNFTRKVMAAIDEHQGGRSMLSANAIALLAAAGILAVVIAVGLVLSRGSTQEPTIGDLRQLVFTNPAVSSDFSQAIPAEWKRFGVEPVISQRERALRSGNPRDTEREHLGGGIHLAAPIAPTQPFALDVSYRVQRSNSPSALQVFVTDEPTFTPPAAATPRELAVDVRDGLVRVFTPDGKLASEPVKIDTRNGGRIVVKIQGDLAIVENDGKQLFAGRHGLRDQSPRYPGVRFLTRGPGSDDLTVSAIRVLRPG